MLLLFFHVVVTNVQTAGIVAKATPDFSGRVAAAVFLIHFCMAEFF